MVDRDVLHGQVLGGGRGYPALGPQEIQVLLHAVVASLHDLEGRFGTVPRVLAHDLVDALAGRIAAHGITRTPPRRGSGTPGG